MGVAYSILYIVNTCHCHNVRKALIDVLTSSFPTRMTAFYRFHCICTSLARPRLPRPRESVANRARVLRMRLLCSKHIHKVYNHALTALQRSIFSLKILTFIHRCWFVARISTVRCRVTDARTELYGRIKNTQTVEGFALMGGMP